MTHLSFYFRLLSLLCLSALLNIGCGSRPSSKYPPHLYYETSMIKLPPLQKNERARLLQHLQEKLGKRKVFKKTGPRSQPHMIFPSAKGLAKLSHAELRALWVALAPHLYGAELDLKIKLPKRKPVPVSIWIDLKGNLTIAKAKWAALPAHPSASTFSKKWKIGGLKAKKDQKWSAKTLRALNLALTLLDPQERALLKRIPFIRKRQGPRPKQAALYVQKSQCNAEIHLFNRAVMAERYTFVGSSSQAYPSTTFSIMHEIGHALHSAPSRRVHCRLTQEYKDYKKQVNQANRTKNRSKRQHRVKAVKATEKDLKQTRKRVKDLQERGPVLEAYQKVIGRSPPPTYYGESSLKESFAESFALYHLDPQALKRVLPNVYAWFNARGHLQALKSNDQ